MKTKNRKKTKAESDTLFNRKDPVGWEIADLNKLIKASGKSLYRIQKETGIPSGFLYYLKSKKKNRLNPSFATLTRIKEALGITWEQLIIPIQNDDKKTK